MKDLQAVRTLYRDAGYANVEAEPETELDPVKREVDIIIPIRRGPLVHVERIEIKGNTKTRDKVLRREMEIEEGQLFSETKLEDSKRRIIALGYFERVDVSTEQGSTPETIIINFEIDRAAHRHVPGRRRLLEHRELHRDRAGPAGEPVRQRAVARAAGADLRAPAAHLASASSSRTSSTPTGRRRVELYDQLYVFPDFARPIARRLAHVRLRAHAAVAAPQRDGHGAERLDRHVAGRHVLRARRSRLRQRLPAAAAREPVQRRPHRLAPPRPHLRHARQPPLPDVGRLPAGVDRARRARFGSEVEFLRHRFIGALLLPARRADRASRARASSSR